MKGISDNFLASDHDLLLTASCNTFGGTYWSELRLEHLLRMLYRRCSKA